MPYQPPIPERNKARQSTPGLQALVEAEKLTQIAITLPAAALVGWLAGAGLDSWLHQSWISVTGVLLGGIAGLIYVVRLAQATGKTVEREDGGPALDQSASQNGSRKKTE
jgi:F0F1-type ATP synthase assembly protein I